MKKLKLLILPLLLGATLLSGCDKNQGNAGGTQYPEINFNQSDYICKGGSYGGFFTEVNIGRALVTETKYEFSLSASGSDKTINIKLSNNNLGSVRMKNNSKSHFFLETNKNYGDLIMTIENARGELVYRNLIKIRKAVTNEEMGQVLYNKDIYKTSSDLLGMYGDWRLGFTEIDPIKGTISGGDEKESNVTITFTIEFVEYQEFRDCNLYNVSEISSTAKETKITALLITRAADTIYVYDKEGLLTIVNEVKEA